MQTKSRPVSVEFWNILNLWLLLKCLKLKVEIKIKHTIIPNLEFGALKNHVKTIENWYKRIQKELKPFTGFDFLKNMELTKAKSKIDIKKFVYIWVFFPWFIQRLNHSWIESPKLYAMCWSNNTDLAKFALPLSYQDTIGEQVISTGKKKQPEMIKFLIIHKKDIAKNVFSFLNIMKGLPNL